jgi:hypothetical protein
MTRMFTSEVAQYVAIVLSVLLIGCGGSDNFDFTCETIDAGIIDASYTQAESNGGFNIIRVFDLQEVGRSTGSIGCRGKAEWSNGSTTPIQMEAVDGPQGIQYRYSVPSKFADGAPTTPVGGDDAGSNETGNMDPSAGGAGVDPSTVTCEQLRPEVVRLSERDRISRGFALLKIYEPTTIKQDDDRLTCHGRAVWTNGSQTQIEYGFYKDSEGEIILTYRDLASDDAMGGSRK